MGADGKCGVTADKWVFGDDENVLNLMEWGWE